MDDSLSRLLGLCNRLVRYRFDSYLKQYGITSPQWGTLNLLYTNESLSQIQLARLSHSDKMTMSAIIDKLLKKQLVQRKVCDTDKRLYEISLTPKGMELVKEVRPHANKLNETAMNCLTLDEQQNLRAYLMRIMEQFDEDTYNQK